MPSDTTQNISTVDPYDPVVQVLSPHEGKPIFLTQAVLSRALWVKVQLAGGSLPLARLQGGEVLWCSLFIWNHKFTFGLACSPGQGSLRVALDNTACPWQHSFWDHQRTQTHTTRWSGNWRSPQLKPNKLKWLSVLMKLSVRIISHGAVVFIKLFKLTLCMKCAGQINLSCPRLLTLQPKHGRSEN